MPNVVRKLVKFLQDHPAVSESLCVDSMLKDGVGGTRLLDLMNETQYRRVLAKMLDESEFLGPHGIRSISRYHLEILMSSRPMVKSFASNMCLLNQTRACSAVTPIGAALYGCRSTS